MFFHTKISHMQKLLVLLFTLVFFIPGIFAQNIKSIPVGTVLPSETVKLKDVSGEQITLQDAKKEKGLVVMFTCNTCPYVVKNQQRTKEVCNYAKSKGLGVVLVNSNAGSRDGGDSYEAMKEYAKTQGYEWNYVMDEGTTLADAFGAARTPEVYVFDANNKLVYKGAIDDNPGDAGAVKKQHLKSAINATSTGQEISVKESKSVGCSIKRS
jgi:peroxiredoxin